MQDGEWKLLELLQRLLTPLEEASLFFCKSPLSTKIPFARALLSQIRQLDLRLNGENDILQGIVEVEEMRTKLLTGIEERFSHLENEKLHAVSTFLDPRFKTSVSMGETSVFRYWAKCPWAKWPMGEMSIGEMSNGRNVQWAKCPMGEMSNGRNVQLAKCPFGEMSNGRNVR
uniref:Uncharacterized protein n=1 Tax=Globodera rostochiensis TaxID=31243 RepID=A0A914HIP8_GLORO